MLGIIQDEHSECAGGARLHHLGGCDPKQLLNQHAALAQLIAEHAVNRAGAVEPTLQQLQFEWASANAKTVSVWK